MTAEQTLGIRRAIPEPGNETRLVMIDAFSGVSTDLRAEAGVKINPSPLPENVIATFGKTRLNAPAFTTRAAREDRAATCASPHGRPVERESFFIDV
jgi:hypothetical protein